MPTAKKQIKVYLEPEIEEYLDRIPAMQRNKWVNTVLLSAITKDEPEEDSLSELHRWLKAKGKKAKPIEEALAQVLDEFYVSA